MRRQHNNCVMSKIFCLHGNPTAFIYAVDGCSLKVAVSLLRISTLSSACGVPPVGCSHWLVGLVKDGWKESKYCSDFRSRLYRWFGRVTRQTGPGIKPRPLFHGGLALSLSLDYTCCVTKFQPFRLIYQSNGRFILQDIIVESLWRGIQ